MTGEERPRSVSGLSEAQAQIRRLQEEQAAEVAELEEVEEEIQSVDLPDDSVFRNTGGQDESGSRGTPDTNNRNMSNLAKASNHTVTVHQDAASMFATTVQVSTSQDTGMCEFPRALRGSDAKTISRARDAATKAPKLLYDLPSYFVTGNFEGSQQEQTSYSTSAEAMKMALIGISYRNAQVKLHLANHDMVNGMMVPHLKDQNRKDPAARWDFSRHVVMCWTTMLRSRKKRSSCGAKTA